MDSNGSLLLLMAELYTRILALQAENTELKRRVQTPSDSPGNPPPAISDNQQQEV